MLIGFRSQVIFRLIPGIESFLGLAGAWAAGGGGAIESDVSLSAAAATAPGLVSSAYLLNNIKFII